MLLEIKKKDVLIKSIGFRHEKIIERRLLEKPRARAYTNFELNFYIYVCDIIINNELSRYLTLT